MRSLSANPSTPRNANAQVLCLAIPPAAILRSTTHLVAFVPNA